jgi:hypothetical protein
MRRSNIFPAFIFIICLISCGLRKQDNESKNKTLNHGSAVGILNGKNLPYSHSSLNDGEKDEISEPKARIPIPKNDKILEIINANLDQDEADEQIILLKGIDNPASFIKIIVIDFDEVRNIYLKTWETSTSSTNPRVLNVEILDVIGDYNREIAVHGMNNRDLTLDIYRKVNTQSKTGLHYQPICQIVSNGTITINKIERSSAYEMGQKAGESFPIIVERRDSNSKNDMDIMEETYSWVYATNKYEMVSSRKIPADLNSQQKLSELYSKSDEETFIQFLKGPWYDKKQTEKMVVFYPEENQVVFSFGNVQEVYNWDYSRRILYNGFLIITHNELIKTIKTDINITARSSNSIDVNMEDNSWAGEYQKFGEELQQKFYEKKNQKVKPSHLQLSGLYQDEFKDEKEGNQIIFEPPFFTWINNKEKISIDGGYSIIENLPITNIYYYKTTYQFVPKEVDNNSFTNLIRKKIATDADDQLLSKFYTFDKVKNAFILSDTITRDEKQKIWELLISIQYKNYINYKLNAITFKIIKSNGTLDRIDNYILEYLEKKESDKVTRSLSLTPGKINVNGIEAINNDSLKFIQINYN